MSALEPARRARLVLSVIGEPGDPRLLTLVEELGPEGVLTALHERSTHGELGDALAERLRAARPEDVLAAATRRGIRFLVPEDEEWPGAVADLGHGPVLHQRGGAPLGLWARGPLRADQAALGAVAVVGSRSATQYGDRVAGEIAATLAQDGRAVVSGAAFGIDQAAHRGALAVRGPTVAVLACGVDRAYPLAHEALLGLIAEEGLVLSEAAPGCAPTRVRFLARNRLIAALGGGVVVVEAAVRSGALNTASWADGLHRTVMGVPGPVTSAASQGVHELIRARNALLVTSGADVLEAMAAAGEHLAVRASGVSHPRDQVSLLQRQVLDAVPLSRGVGVQRIARAAGLSVDTTAVALDALEQAALVERAEDRWRVRP